MKLLKFTVGILILLLFICCYTYAAPAGNTADTRMPPGDGFFHLKDSIGSVKLSFDFDAIIEKDLEADNSTNLVDEEIEGEWYMAKISYPIFNGKIEPYLKLGVADLEVSWKQNGKNIIIKGDNAMAWGAGIKFLAFEMPEHRVKFAIDTQYRTTNPDIADASVNVPSRTISAEEYEIQEWQIAGILSIEIPIATGRQGLRRRRKGRRHIKRGEIYSLVPYVGIAYTDSKIEASFIESGTLYDVDDADNTDKVVLIGGADLLAPENVSINIEGRIIGEISLGGGATVRF